MVKRITTITVLCFLFVVALVVINEHLEKARWQKMSNEFDKQLEETEGSINKYIKSQELLKQLERLN